MIVGQVWAEFPNGISERKSFLELVKCKLCFLSEKQMNFAPTLFQLKGQRKINEIQLNEEKNWSSSKEISTPNSFFF